MDRPRVIFVNRVYWPSTAATAQLLTDLAEGLAAGGWSVQVIAAGGASTRQNGVTIHRTGNQDRHGGLVSRALNYGRFRRHARRQLAAILRPGDAVVVMTDPPLLGSALAAVVNGGGGRLIHWIQDIYPEIVGAHAGTLVDLVLRPLRNRRDAAWHRASRCVILGTDMMQTLTARRVPAGRISLLPNWAPRELQIPATAEAVAACRTAWGVTGKFVVAYSGNLGRVHEFATVIAAAERLKERKEIVFLFIGTGARFAEVRAAAQARRLDNLRLLPPAPRTGLAASLSAADVQLVTLDPAFARLVYPSKLAGALAAGRPVLFVGPPDGEIARLLAGERCGAAVAPDDSSRLAAVLAAWQADPAQCSQLGHNARAAYERDFAYATALDRWADILRGPKSGP